MKSKRRCRFINLAEQLAAQNDIVSSTMDSLMVRQPTPTVSELQLSATYRHTDGSSVTLESEHANADDLAPRGPHSSARSSGQTFAS